ncbi:MAG: hypothetical protein Q4B26_20265, partial [Eubacteriales bacterium]|nr:hypothetical protein [Eubacteriales bacterium]
MKITYLVFDETTQGRLRVATKDEWKLIMVQNRTLPREQRRFFIEDCIHEGGELDCIFIETSKEDYDKWHREAQKKYRKKQHLDGISVVSIDLEESEDSGMALIGKLSDNLDWEMRMLSDIRMQELRRALSNWKPWALEMLELYLDGRQRQAAKSMSVR